MNKKELQAAYELGILGDDDLISIVDDTEDLIDPDNEYYLQPRNPTAETRKRSIAIAAMAKEYLYDFNYQKAAARANIPQRRAKELFMDRLFLQTVQEIIDLTDPEIVVKRQEIMLGLRKEATNDYATPNERTAAWKELARLSGMDPALKVKHELDAPVINLTLTQPEKKAEKVIELNGKSIDLNGSAKLL